MCTDTQYPSVVKEEPAFLCTVSVHSLVYPVYVRVRLNICKIRDQPPLTLDIVPGNHLSPDWKFLTYTGSLTSNALAFSFPSCAVFCALCLFSTRVAMSGCNRSM